MMKKALVPVLLLLAATVHAQSPDPSADELLSFVRSHLPQQPITLTGTLRVTAPNGFLKNKIPVEMELKWGGVPPRAVYRVGEKGTKDFQTLEITWDSGNRPVYTFSRDGKIQPDFDPAIGIFETGINWGDLSFSMLWWKGGTVYGSETMKGRDCHVIDLPVPGTGNTMRLWIEKKMGLLMESQTFDAEKKQIQRVKVISLKKINDMWVVKDLDIINADSKDKTTLRIDDLKVDPVEPVAPVAPTIAFDPADSINRFAVRLYQKLSTKDNENLFCSPASISTALAMTYGGARGDTAAQMEDTLHFAGQGITHPAFDVFSEKLDAIQRKGQVQLSVVNSLWPQVDYKFLPDYLAMVKEFYGSEIESVNYKTDAEGARLKINGWVEDKTNDRIKDLISTGTLDGLTRLVLANAIYFKGNWASQFKTEATRPAPFTLTNGKTVEVPMMSQKGKFMLAHGKDFQALELPYEGGDLSMLVLLPTESDGLPALEKTLSLEMLIGLQLQETEVMVQLPKFKLESSFGLGDTLKAMGMPLAFSDQADFSGMDGSRNLFIGAVVHKAFVEVNEEGTEAAAATAVIISRTSMPPQFTANHAFLFLIRENSTGAILFIGRVMDPSK